MIETWAIENLVSRSITQELEPSRTLCDFLLSTSACVGTALPLLSPGTFLLRNSAPSGDAPEAWVALLLVILLLPD